MSVLSAHDREMLAEVIGEVEAGTAGEIVVSTVGRSDDYAWFRAPLSAVSAALIAASLGLALSWDASPVVLIHLLLNVALYQALGAPSLIRGLISADTLKERTEARAYQLFSELGVHRTTAGSGILIMISECEHRVVILADYGIHARIQAGEWQTHVDAIVAGIQQGRAAAVVAEEVRALGRLLAAEFPPEPANPNQLPNVVEHRDS